MFKYSTISGPVAVAGLTLMLALGACSSGGDGPPPAKELAFSGLEGMSVEAGTYELTGVSAEFEAAAASVELQPSYAEGATVEVGGLVFACTSGPCSLAFNADDTITTTGTIAVSTAMAAVPEPEPEPVDPGPTDLETAQAAAAAAAAAAMTASDNAAASAKMAMDGTANVATLQTGEMAGMYAMQAGEAAGSAMSAAASAKTASDAAAAATLASAAGVAAADAEKAQALAEKAEELAGGLAMKAAEAAKTELMIDGKNKSVGESMLNAGDGMLTTTNDDDSKTITGRQNGMDPMETVAATKAGAGRQDDPNTAAKDEAMTPMVVAAARSLTVGRMLDSSDDAARLMLMTHRAVPKTVRVYVESDGETTTDDGSNDAVLWSSARSGRINVDAAANSGNADDHATAAPKYVSLRAVGEYYPVDGVTGFGNTPETDEDGTANDDPTTIVPTGSVRGDDHADGPADPQTVYVFDDDDTTDDTAKIKRYVVLEKSETENGKTTNTYRLVYTMVTLPGVGPEAPLPAGKSAAGPKEVNVMAKLPVAMAYDHVHFGVWADLSDAKDDGSQTIAGLGIGFVQSVGAGMTGADMPNAGNATYNGNWAAAVQQRNAGAISLVNGAATLTANLDKSTLTANLTGLATLSGAIDGSSFSGTKATGVDGMHGLNSGGKFDGTFSGGFYGPAAAEAGGIFDFSSKDMADGAFRGAFGGAKAE